MTHRPMIVRIVSDWDSSGLLRQTPGGAGMWDGICFTTRPVEEYDLLVMLNNRKLDPVSARCAPGNVWTIMQEPYVPGLFDWLVEGHEPYARVFTHLTPSEDPKYVPSQPALPWGVGLSYDELVVAAVPEKTRGASWIASNLTFLPAHKRRNRLRRYLLEEAPDLVDHFGRGVRPVARKWEALAPYRFSLAVENSVGPHLWTEKVADCFLAWTVPLYFGCTNLEEYFPEDSFVRVDAGKPAAVCATLEKLVESNEWERRLPALEVARRRVLEEYQIFPWLARAINAYGLDPGPASPIHIPGYRWRRWRHRLRYLHHKIRSGEAADLLNVFVNKAKYIWWFHV